MRKYGIALAAVSSLLLGWLPAPLAADPAETVVSETFAPLRPALRRYLGYGRLTSNDLFGDTEDRWRTGSVTSSRAWGYAWDGRLPSRFGELLELRLQGQVIAPANLRRPAPGDRPFAGALSVGLHSHFERNRTEYALGADLVVIGPDTGLGSFHREFHDILGKPQPSQRVLAAQIGNTVRPTFVAEVGRTVGLGGNVFLRPFAEARAGDETLARIGADLSIGTIGQGELLARESITGQRYRVIYNSAPGTTFTLGGDIAHVADSVYLPDGRGYTLEPVRTRLRAGLHWQGQSASIFYGLTYLSEEFSTQSEGQLTGSVRLRLRF